MTKVIQGLFRAKAPFPAAAVAQPRPAIAAVPIAAATLRLGGPQGRPLPPTVLQRMEAAFAADFSDVRVHEGPEAAAIGAVAFTHGSSIYFEHGRFRPETAEGRRLLAHELAHVLQQRAGRVRNPFGTGLAVVREPALEAEADRLAQRAALAPPRPRAPSAPAPTPRFPSAQAALPHRLMPLPMASGVVQRADADAGATVRVKLGGITMSGDYQSLMRIWFSYSRSDGQNFGDAVIRDFKIATHLGIAPYTTDNHASDNPGGPGDGQKAREEHDHYDAWRLLHAGRLDAVEILPEGGGKRSTGAHISAETKQKQVDRKDQKAATAERSKHVQWHARQGQAGLAIAVNQATCPTCGLAFKT